MGKRNRVYGLMVGITIGFAFWGGIQKPSGVMTGKPSELSEESEQQQRKQQAQKRTDSGFMLFQLF